MTDEEFYQELFSIIGSSHGHTMLNNADTRGSKCFLSYIMSNNKEGIKTTPSMLAKKFEISTARVARAINTLVDKKYVTRVSSDTDLRKAYLDITDDGIEFLKNDKIKRDEFFKKAIKGLTDEEKRVMLSSFKKIANNIKDLEGDK